MRTGSSFKRESVPITSNTPVSSQVHRSLGVLHPSFRKGGPLSPSSPHRQTKTGLWAACGDTVWRLGARTPLRGARACPLPGPPITMHQQKAPLKILNKLAVYQATSLTLPQHMLKQLLTDRPVAISWQHGANSGSKGVC